MAGLGTVGRETVRLLLSNREKFARRLGAKVELAAVCDIDVSRKAQGLGLARGVLRLKDPGKLAPLRNIDVIVELLGGLDAPRALVLAALRSGRHVVTANKRLLSHCWDEIERARASRGGRLYFEGSVAGGIPILAALDGGFSANRIEAVYGILNGTTNYVLTRAEEGLGMAEALREAQQLGFAEKDPAADMSGEDTAQKVSVLAALLTGRSLAPSRIAREGITRIEREDLDFARNSLNRAARLLGALRLSGRDPVRVEAYVSPTLVPLGHPLAAVRREYNAVLVKASSAGELMFYGKGAGAGPAASAVAGDVFMLCRDILGQAPPRRSAAVRVELSPISESVSSFYLRLSARDRPGVLARIAAALGRRGISIASIHQSGVPRAAGVPVVITTHPTTHGRFHAALHDILALKSVARTHAVMRLFP